MTSPTGELLQTFPLVVGEGIAAIVFGFYSDIKVVSRGSYCVFVFLSLGDA